MFAKDKHEISGREERHPASGVEDVVCPVTQLLTLEFEFLFFSNTKNCDTAKVHHFNDVNTKTSDSLHFLFNFPNLLSVIIYR